MFQSVWEYCKFRQQLFTNIISELWLLHVFFYWHWLDEINQLPRLFSYTHLPLAQTLYPRLYVLCSNTKCYIVILIILCCTSFNKNSRFFVAMLFLRSSFVSVIPFKVFVDESEYFFGTERKDTMQMSSGVVTTDVKPLVNCHQQSLLQRQTQYFRISNGINK